MTKKGKAYFNKGPAPAEAATTTFGARLVQAAEEAAAFARGELTGAVVHRPPAQVDVRAVRLKRGMTQAEFAGRYGFTLGAVRDWEQKRRVPEAAARILLHVIDAYPETVEKVLENAR